MDPEGNGSLQASEASEVSRVFVSKCGVKPHAELAEVCRERIECRISTIQPPTPGGQVGQHAGQRGLLLLEPIQRAPLPDEAFDWAVVPSEASERVGEVVALVDRGCDALLDAECRTAARRLLADVAAADPDAVRRGRADTAAAALLWAVTKANDRFSAGGLTAKELQGWVGVSGSASQRAATLLKAIGVAPQASAGGLALGTARYLTGDRRRAIVERRERAEAMSD